METSLRRRRTEDSDLSLEPSLRKRIAAESDFDPLRQDPDFQYLTRLEQLTDL
jgi:hypothetical protein